MTVSRRLVTKPNRLGNSGSSQQDFNDDLQRKLNRFVFGFGPLLPNVLVADLPGAGVGDVETGMTVFVTDASTPVPAYFDGTVWRSFITGLVIV